MSELTVGSISGLAVNNYVVDVAAGSQLTQPGMVLQVVQGVKTDVFSTTSGTFQNTTASASITPSSTSSKILVCVYAQTGQSGSSDSTFLTIYRDSTNISPMTAYSQNDFARTYTASTSEGYQTTIQYLDSPNTTSEITYSLYVRTDSIGGTAYIGRISANTSTTQPTIITLMEIAQ